MTVPRLNMSIRPADALADRPRNDLELDHAFLRWFEARLANSGPEPQDEGVVDYLVAWALSANA
jgi:hypothetical protein